MAKDIVHCRNTIEVFGIQNMLSPWASMTFLSQKTTQSVYDRLKNGNARYLEFAASTFKSYLNHGIHNRIKNKPRFFPDVFDDIGNLLF